MKVVERPAGGGWLALVGGGEFSFGETYDADEAWLAKVPEGGAVGFLPTASGSIDYGHHFADYLEGEFARLCEIVPVYRGRDARRGKNLERIAESAAVYVGGGVADDLLDTLADSPAAEALLEKLRSGGTVVAIAAAAQVFGRWARSLDPRGEHLPGLGWLPGGVVEPNFAPDHDRRLRKLLAQPGARWGLGLPAGSALLLGPEGEREVVGTVFTVDGPEGDLEAHGEPWDDEPELEA